MSESRNPESGQEKPEPAQTPAEDAPTTPDAGDSATPAPEAPREEQQGAEAAEPPARGEASAPPPRRGGRGLLALTLLIALAAGGAAGYLGWRLYQLEQGVAGIPAEREAALEAALQPYLQSGTLQPLRARIEALEAGREDISRQVEQRIGQLQETIETVRAGVERHQIGWRLAEIRYLVSIAARRLQIAYDLRGAEAALEAADASVAELEDVRLLPLRKAIVEDLDKVRAVEPVDIEGIALRLQSLLAQVEGLPRAPLRGAGDDADDAPADAGWWQRLRSRLRDFVVIQRRPSGPAELDPRAADGLRPAEALTLALEDARRAAVARDGDIYAAALERAAEVLDAHFDPEAGATARFRQGLAGLRGRNIETELPDLTDTVTLANRLAREIEHARRDAATAQPAAGD